ncbi:MAG: hypothetical protein NZM09_07045 [Ignavibacterium sp.]|nr:hypothetical protein [Ignavibacterium sp.]MCX7610446.1 hypothetical protein [Ignavibacterium sp.]MDW8375437.1 hypothetical protein [Ignavibacteriales bacterium]
MLNKKTISLIILFLIGIVFISCSDEPSDLGANLLTTDMIDVLKLDSNRDSLYQISSSVKRVIPLGTSSRLLLGKYQNQTAYTLISFLFTLPDSIKQLVKKDSIEVVEAKAEMNLDYYFGQKDGFFDFSVYEIQSNWTSAGFTADSFASLNYSSIDLSSNRVGSDTLYTFNINNNIIKNWLKNSADTSLAQNRGVLLSPKPNSQKIIGFVAFDPNFARDTKIKVIYRKLGAYTDTLTALVLSDVSIVVGDNQIDSNYITIQSSLVYNGILKFDLSKISRGSIVNYSQLTLTLDTLKSKFGSNYLDEIHAYIITNSDSLKINESNVYPLKRKGNNYIGDISGMVRYWMANNPNFGILLKPARELVGMEKFVIKSSSFPIYDERPKIEIIYTKRK